MDTNPRKEVEKKWAVYEWITGTKLTPGLPLKEAISHYRKLAFGVEDPDDLAVVPEDYSGDLEEYLDTPEWKSIYISFIKDIDNEIALATSKNPPSCPSCGGELGAIKSNPPGAMVCLSCAKGWMPNPSLIEKTIDEVIAVSKKIGWEREKLIANIERRWDGKKASRVWPPPEFQLPPDFYNRKPRPIHSNVLIKTNRLMPHFEKGGLYKANYKDTFGNIYIFSPKDNSTLIMLSKESKGKTWV